MGRQLFKAENKWEGVKKYDSRDLFCSITIDFELIEHWASKESIVNLMKGAVKPLKTVNY